MRFSSVLLRNKYVIIHNLNKITKITIANFYIIIEEENYYLDFIMSGQC